MILKNNGKAFELIHGGQSYEIKKGENEFDNIYLVRFILSKAKDWELEVFKVVAEVKKVTKKAPAKVAKKVAKKKPAKKAVKKNKKK